MLSQRIGFLGAGRMATALARGIVQAQLVTPNQLYASDTSPHAREHFQAALPDTTVLAENRTVAEQADIVLLAVKPQNIETVLADLQPTTGPDKLVISIAAGVTLTRLAGGLAAGTRLVRVMPNTPCLIGQGASAYSLGDAATAADGQLVHDILSAVGQAHLVPEKLLDAVTGLSGSGPAFVYTVIEALADAGRQVELPDDLAQALAVQTTLGAACMVQQTGESPAELRERVTSPGGTTVAGLEALAEHGLATAIAAAVQAATARSKQLGEHS